MDRLILFRHGKAEPDSDSGDDFDRRLAPRGVRESVSMAGRLAEMGFRPQVALLSPAARALATWDAVCSAFPEAEPRIDKHLYHADSSTVRAAAEQALEGCSTVMVIGHNPGLQELAVRLLHEGHAPIGLIAKAQRSFPTAAAAVFLLDGNGQPAFDGLFYPER